MAGPVMAQNRALDAYIGTAKAVVHRGPSGYWFAVTPGLVRAYDTHADALDGAHTALETHR